jgi:Bacterial dnaA protein helix-turn-helix
LGASPAGLASFPGKKDWRLNKLHATNENPAALEARRGTVTLAFGGEPICETELATPFSHFSPPAVNRRAVTLAYPSIFAVQAAVAMRFGIETLDLVSHRRGPEASRPRMLVYWLCRHCTLASIADISRALGRDHSTVAHGIRRVEELLRLDAGFAWAAVSLRYELTPREAVA